MRNLREKEGEIEEKEFKIIMDACHMSWLLLTKGTQNQKCITDSLTFLFGVVFVAVVLKIIKN